jgi:fused signal recognition particle receptor
MRSSATLQDRPRAGDTIRLHARRTVGSCARRRVAAKGAGQVTEVLLVVDATTGRTASRKREFSVPPEVTGVVLTKLDGSAKGGIVLRSKPSSACR